MELNIPQAYELIKKASACVQPCLMRGKIGIAKSSIPPLLARDLYKEYTGEDGSLSVVDARLSQFHPTEIQGLPYRGEDNTMHYSPVWFLKEVNKQAEEMEKNLIEGIGKAKAESCSVTAILFLDEINLAPPAVQNTCYQLILDRRIGENKLHPKVMIIAAGNQENDKANIYPMPAPLKNRLIIMDVKLEPDTWVDWALTSHIHPAVISFVKAYPALIHTFDKNQDVFATPRRWHQVSSLLKKGLTFRQYEYASMLGDAAGRQFYVYIRYLNQIGAAEIVEQLLEGKSINIFKTVLENNEKAAKHAKKGEDKETKGKRKKDDDDEREGSFDGSYVMPAISNIITSYIQRIGDRNAKGKWESTDFILKLIKKYGDDAICGDANCYRSIMEYTRTTILKTYQNDDDYIAKVLASDIVEIEDLK